MEVGPGITWPSSGPLDLKEVVKDWVHKGWFLKGETSNGVLEYFGGMWTRTLVFELYMYNRN